MIEDFSPDIFLNKTQKKNQNKTKKPCCIMRHNKKQNLKIYFFKKSRIYSEVQVMTATNSKYVLEKVW